MRVIAVGAAVRSIIIIILPHEIIFPLNRHGIATRNVKITIDRLAIVILNGSEMHLWLPLTAIIITSSGAHHI